MLRRCGLLCAVLSLTLLISFTTACGSSSSGAKIRLVNTMPDESNLDLLIDTKSAVTGVAYGAASSYVSVANGSRQFQIEPSGSTTILIDRTDNIASGNTLSLVTLNFSSNPSSILLADDNSAPTTGDFKLRVLNASSGMLTQDVYVVTAGTDIGSVDPTRQRKTNLRRRPSANAARFEQSGRRIPVDAAHGCELEKFEVETRQAASLP
jgi:hypothetical protein